MEASIPAGWYPDPEHDDLDRYWDGTQWTEQRREADDPLRRMMPSIRLRIGEQSDEALTDVDTSEAGISGFATLFSNSVAEHTKVVLTNADLFALIESNPRFLPLAIFLGTGHALIGLNNAYRTAPESAQRYVSAFVNLGWEAYKATGIKSAISLESFSRTLEPLGIRIEPEG